jgi:hypothetical protein
VLRGVLAVGMPWFHVHINERACMINLGLHLLQGAGTPLLCCLG